MYYFILILQFSTKVHLLLSQSVDRGIFGFVLIFLKKKLKQKGCV